MSIFHHTTTPNGDHSWLIDQAAIAHSVPWAKQQPQALVDDIRQMANYFPHWILVGCRGDTPQICQECRTPIVPTQGAFRCLMCAKPAEVSNLQWLGNLPTPARSEPQFSQALERLRAAGFGEVQADGQHYVLVPLRIIYPAKWPHQAPTVRYNPRWLQCLGLPASSAAHHIVSGGAACIYSYNDWHPQTVNQVLGQRMLNHVLSLCKIAAGQSPRAAFLGRVAH